MWYLTCTSIQYIYSTVLNLQSDTVGWFYFVKLFFSALGNESSETHTKTHLKRPESKTVRRVQKFEFPTALDSLDIKGKKYLHFFYAAKNDINPNKIKRQVKTDSIFKRIESKESVSLLGLSVSGHDCKIRGHATSGRVETEMFLKLLLPTIRINYLSILSLERIKETLTY